MVQRLSFSRSFGFIERRRAVPCRTCFRARRQLKASLCNERRSSGHWVCISLALPTVPPSLSLFLPRDAVNRLKRVPKNSARVIALFLFCVLSPSFSLSIVIIVTVLLNVVLRKAIVQDWCKPITANLADRPALLYATIKYFKNRLTPEFLIPNMQRSAPVTGGRFLPLRNVPFVKSTLIH